MALLVHKIIQNQGIDFFGTILSVLFPVLILLPLFALGLFGGADLKLLGMLGICFSFKDVMTIFVFSLFIGLAIGIIKALVCHSFWERFRYLFRFFKNIYIRLSVKDTDIFDETYMDVLDKDTLKRGSVHFSLPILIGVILKIIGG